jgi:hypothetical protein
VLLAARGESDILMIVPIEDGALPRIYVLVSEESGRFGCRLLGQGGKIAFYIEVVSKYCSSVEYFYAWCSE